MAAGSRLPVLGTVRDAFAASVLNLGYFLRMAWAWMALTLVVHTLVSVALHYSVPKTPGGGFSAGDAWELLADALVPLPLIASTAVAWHRFMVRGERVTEPVYLAFGPAVQRYAMVAFLMLLLVAVPIVALSLIETIETPITAETILTVADVLMIMLLPLLAAGYIVASRLSLWLPAVALQRDGATAAWAWQAARGNTWRLVMGCVLCALPCLCLLLALALAGGQWLEQTGLMDALTRPVYSMIATLLIGLPTLTFLSLAYRKLVLERD